MTLLGDIENIGGELVGRSRGRAHRFPTGRVCEEPGCKTRLSVYNSRPRCAAHDFDPTLMNFRAATTGSSEELSPVVPTPLPVRHRPPTDRVRRSSAA